jgi:hypothetical protein
VKPILPQFPSHPGIQGLLGRQGVAANDIDQILSTGAPHERKALASSGPAPRREDFAGGHHLLLDCKEAINNYWESFNKLFYRDTVDSNRVFYDDNSSTIGLTH